MPLCLRYVNKKGAVVECFIGVVHVKGTTAVTLKKAIHSLLADHSLSPSKIRGQGYDGASNMKGEINGLKTLILKESPSAYYIHFSCKRNEMLKEAQAQNVAQAFDDDEYASGKGKNQELGLGRPGDTRWGSHYKLINNVISLYSIIVDVLDKIGDVSYNPDNQLKAETVSYALESFDFVFLAHLMKRLFGVANDLNYALQKKDQDIVEAMSLVELTKERLQIIRNDGWEDHLKLTISFCEKNGIEVPKMEDVYVPRGRKKRRQQQLITLAEFYPNEFPRHELSRLSDQLDNYIHDMRKDERFIPLKDVGDLSLKLVELKKHTTYDLVYLLIKLVLILPVATASVERTFSAMTYVKNKLRNSIGDQFLNDCLVTYIEKDVFFEVSDDTIMNRFQLDSFYDAHTEIACRMLGSMEPEYIDSLIAYPYGTWFQELRSSLRNKLGVEKICGATGTSGYMYHRYLSRLNQLMAFIKILVGFCKKITICISMGKQLVEIHAMLIEYEKGLPKKAETPQVMMIRDGKIQKANKKSLKAKGKNKVNGKGKDKKEVGPLEQNCSCVSRLSCKRKGSKLALPVLQDLMEAEHGALYLYVGNGSSLHK
ncbi:zinc finger MYM-type protein 1-like protein [Tanacetum coccineum]